MNLILASMLAMSTATIVPCVSMVLDGIGGWTSRLGLLSGDLNGALRDLSPIVVTTGLVVVGIYLSRRRLPPRSRRSYADYPEID